jgi:uridine kinase
VTVVDRLAALVSQTAPGRRARVAIDGRGCSGKTTLADRLASAVAPHRPVVRAGIDDFNHPRAHRYRRGLESARGCYEDTFDFAALRSLLIDPLGPDGSGLHRTRVFDVVADQPVDQPARLAAPNAVLLLDGCRLLQPDWPVCWDLVVLLRVPDDELLRRAVVRDAHLFGGPEEVEHRYRTRYLPAERLYEQQARPADRADVILDNTDPAAPVVLRWPG